MEDGCRESSKPLGCRRRWQSGDSGTVNPYSPSADYYGYPYPYPAYAPPVIEESPFVYESAPVAAEPVQREVVYPHGKYVLYGDGVNQPWQWVWVPAAVPPTQ